MPQCSTQRSSSGLNVSRSRRWPIAPAASTTTGCQAMCRSGSDRFHPHASRWVRLLADSRGAGRPAAFRARIASRSRASSSLAKCRRDPASSWSAARAADQLEAGSRRHFAKLELARLREAIRARNAAGLPAPRLSASSLTQRLACGWNRSDPLLHMAWHPVVVDAAGAMGHRRDLETLRPELERWVEHCGIQEPWCRNAAVVARKDTGDPVAWTLPLSRQELDTAVYALTSACFYLTSALSGMRASELVELAAGCRTQEERPGGPRFRLITRRIKGEVFGGAEDAWVVIGDVDRAISMAAVSY